MQNQEILGNHFLFVFESHTSFMVSDYVGISTLNAVPAMTTLCLTGLNHLDDVLHSALEAEREV